MIDWIALVYIHRKIRNREIHGIRQWPCTPSEFLIDLKRTIESLVLSSQTDEKDNEKIFLINQVRHKERSENLGEYGRAVLTQNIKTRGSSRYRKLENKD